MIPRSGRSPGEGICYPLQYSWVFFVAQVVKNPPAVRETWVGLLGWEHPLEKGKAIHFSILAWRIPWTTVCIVHGLQRVEQTERFSLSLSLDLMTPFKPVFYFMTPLPLSLKE